jgi:hypothetical protein
LRGSSKKANTSCTGAATHERLRSVAMPHDLRDRSA